jgi:protein O-GlcNAc transferase
MDPHMAENDKRMFYKYLDRASKYFEWGSGGSTCAASKKPNIKEIISVESDKSWIKAMRETLGGKSHVKLRFIDLQCVPNSWGRPGPTCPKLDQRSYSDQILDQQGVDLVLIDGRYRVACCLKAHRIIGDDCVVLFDDFLDRPQYHAVLEYYNIIEQTADKRMVALKKKHGVAPPPLERIEKYELDEK